MMVEMTIMEQQRQNSLAPAQTSANATAESLADKANDIERRLRILEDRYSTMRKKTQTTDENLLNLERRSSKEFKMAVVDILELKRQLAALQEKLSQFASELEATAKRPDMKVLETYVSFFEPMQFVTRQDVKAALSQLKKS